MYNPLRQLELCGARTPLNAPPALESQFHQLPPNFSRECAGVPGVRDTSQTPLIKHLQMFNEISPCNSPSNTCWRPGSVSVECKLEDYCVLLSPFQRPIEPQQTNCVDNSHLLYHLCPALTSIRLGLSPPLHHCVLKHKS